MNIYQIISQNCQQSTFYAFLTGLIIFLIGSIFILPLLAFIIAMAFGIDQAGIEQILLGNMAGTSRELAVFRLVQGANQLASWGLAGGLMAYFLGKPREVLLLYDRPPYILFFPILIILMSLPLVQGSAFNAETFNLPEFLSGLETWTHEREAQSQVALMQILDAKGVGALLFNLVIFALLPSICEEFFFRGFLQGLFRRVMDDHVAIVLVAFIFSFIHLQFYGFFPRFILGILLGYFVYASGSLYPAMIAHFFFNGFSIVMVQLAGENGLISTDMNGTEVAVPLYAIALSLVLTILALRYYFKTSS